MSQQLQPWMPSIGLSPVQRQRTAVQILQCETSPHEASKAARDLIKAWPHARPPDPDGYAASLAAVLSQYPLGLVTECCDPRVGLARSREFPPTVACVVAWCDRRLDYHRKWAIYRPIARRPEKPDPLVKHPGIGAWLVDLAKRIREFPKAAKPTPARQSPSDAYLRALYGRQQAAAE